MKKYYIATLISIVSLSLFSGCSTKKVFEPENVSQEWQQEVENKFSIVEVGKNLARYEDNTLLLKDATLHLDLDSGYNLLLESDGWILSSTIDGKLKCRNIKDKNVTKNFDLKKTIASASIHNNILAVLFADSEMALYDFTTKEILFKEMGLHASVVDDRISPPYFMGDLVLFPTLDGKVVIVHSVLKKSLRKIIVSSEKNFNNIIYLSQFDDKIIAATGTKILSLGEKENRVEYESRAILHDRNNLYIATKQGEIVSLTSTFSLNAKIKFPFAHFLGMIASKNKLYVLEKEGYLIVLDKDLKNYQLYEVELDDGYVFINNNTFYVADQNISIK